MQIISPNFQNNSTIPAKYTCQGENISPELHFFNIPINAKSLVLIMDDPDAPNQTFTHWIMWNIEPTTKILKENIGPNFAVQGLNSAQTNQYIGPCPPSGIHRYFFTIYAIDSLLDLPQNTNKEGLLKALEGKIIDKNQLMGTYKKSKTSL